MRLVLCLSVVFAAITCGLCEKTIYFDRIEVKFYNRTYLHDPMVDVSVNKKSVLINAKGKVVKDMGMNIKADVQVYQLLDGEYKIFPMSITVNACEEVEKNTMGIKDFITNYSDGPGACPLKKGNYHVKNGIIDLSKFPAQIPEGSFKAVAKINNDDDYVAELAVFGSVKEN